MFNKTFLMAAVASVAIILPATGTIAQQSPKSPRMVTPQPSLQPPQRLALPLNKSQVLHVNETVTRITVGNPDIVDAVALDDHSFYVLGKGIGTTNISVFADSRLLAVIDANVSIDLEAVKASLHANLPKETIEVRAVNDTIALSGVVSSASKVNQAVEIAKHFLPKDANATGKASPLINHLGVSGSQQVMLQVRIAEMSRSLGQQLGFHPSGLVGAAANLQGAGFFLTALNTLTSTSLNGSQGTIAAGAGRIGKGQGSFNFSDILDAQEQKGTVKILAEPNLVAMSGETASFLAGGEFPVPTAQTTNNGVPTITVEFKPFGVSLAFTPTVIGDDLINLLVAPEVSQIDNQTAPVIVNGFSIPGISTRRLKTSVELRDGQSFAIGGLLQSDFADKVKQIPGIGDIPIIGALTRDTDFQRNETELVIIVTPKLVHPAPAGTLVAPTDSFVPPGQGEIFFNGRTEAPDSGVTAGGGLTGHYGHIVR
jgi:pilus assembly protein CpaC